jgi:hypothetical protein
MGYLGKVEDIKIYARYPTTRLLAHGPIVLTPGSNVFDCSPHHSDGVQEALVTFSNPQDSSTALLLTGTELADRTLVVVHHPFSVASLPGSSSQLSTATTSKVSAPVQEAADIAAAASIPGDSSKQDEPSTTVYVGNLNPSVTQQELAALFEPCGQTGMRDRCECKETICSDVGSLVQVRISGDTNQLTRYAFVEFTTAESAAVALEKNGTSLRDRPLK